nr:MAG TPA: hypothetical protein [Caudoviricetes sp.]
MRSEKSKFILDNQSSFAKTIPPEMPNSIDMQGKVLQSIEIAGLLFWQGMRDSNPCWKRYSA